MGRRRKIDLEKEYKKAKYKIEKLEAELKQTKQKVDEMKKENETLESMMEAEIISSKKQIQSTETSVSDRAPSPSGPPPTSADPSLTEFKIFPTGLRSHTKAIPHDQPFEAQVVFDFTGVLPANYLPAGCHVSIYAKSITTALRQRLAESKFQISQDRIPLNLEAKPVQKGHYRLEIELSLYKLGQKIMPFQPPPPSFLLNGGRIHVY